MSEKIKHYYEFEDYRLDADNPGLWRGSQLIAVVPKALETLILLVSKKGEIVSREELIETIWKDTFVEDGNINYTISLLRKIFDNKNLIETIPRRGYRFTAPVRETSNSTNVSLPAIEHVTSRPVKSSLVGWLTGSALVAGIVLIVSVGYFGIIKTPSRAPVISENKNADAMHFYQRGKLILESRSVENREEKAIDEFQKAVTADPTLAIAYAGLAEGFASAAVKLTNPKGRGASDKARSAAEKSLMLDPNLAEGFLIRGWLRRNVDWDWSGAEEDLRHAIELNPNNATAHQRLSQILVVVGRKDEALAEIDKAFLIDPLSDHILGSRFPILEARRDYDTALKESEKYLSENKNNVAAARAFATFLYHKQDYVQVIEISEMNMAKSQSKVAFAWLSLLGSSYQKTGQSEKAEEALKQLELLSHDDSKALYSLSMNYAEMGHSDEAIAGLEKCLEMHEERMVWLNVEPRFANLRGDARFQVLLQKMKLN